MARKQAEQDEPVQAESAGPDPETHVYDEAKDEVVAMPSGQWTAAVTEAGNPRHKDGLLILAP